MRNRSGAKSIAGRLARAEAIFEVASLDRKLRFLKHPCISDPRKLPSTKEAYRAAITIAKAILLNQGIEVQRHGRDVMLPCVLINMEDVFEAYLRATLERNLRNYGFAVLDGNLSEPSGAARALFDRADPSVKENRAKPDIVIRGSSLPSTVGVVIDAKYKPPSGQADREDVNQVLVYSIVYGCKRVALAYPRRKPAEPIIQKIGSVGGVEVFRLLMDLGSSTLNEEEVSFAGEIKALLNTVASATT